VFTIRAREAAVQDSEHSVHKMHEKDSEDSVYKMHEKTQKTQQQVERVGDGRWSREMEDRRWEMGSGYGPCRRLLDEFAHRKLELTGVSTPVNRCSPPTPVLTEVSGPNTAQETNHLRLYIAHLPDRIEANRPLPELIITEPSVSAIHVSPDALHNRLLETG